MPYSLTPAEYELTLAKVAKINDRAERRGFTGRIDVIAELKEIKRTNAAGIEVTEMRYETSIEGEPPAYNGWTLIAALDFDPHAGLIVRTAPGVDKVDRSDIVEGKCDHCKQDRRRRKAFLVSDGHQQLQVGSTCLKDFLGWDTSPTFIDTDAVVAELSESWGSMPREWSTETVLAAAWAAIKVNGFVPASMPGATRDMVYTIMDPPAKIAREIRETFGPLMTDARPMAIKVREWILSDEFAGDNEYVLNLKAVCRADIMSPRNAGLLVSAPQAMARAQERSLVKQRERAEIQNVYVGAIKERITVNVRVKAVRWLENDWGSTCLYTLIDDQNRVFKWFASRDALGEEVTEKFETLTGTVKKHEEFNGQKSTVLTRCKIGA